MPFVFDPDLIWERPTKRRKITPSLAMARYRQEGEASPEPQDDQHADEEFRTARRTSDEGPVIRTSDREELIQCIKRGQRPTWVPKPNLEALCAEANAHAEVRMGGTSKQVQEDAFTEDKQPQPPTAHPSTPPPPPPQPPSGAARHSQSALHAGDFYQSDDQSDDQSGSPLQISTQSQQPSTPSTTQYSDSPPPWAFPSSFHHSQRTTSDPASFETALFDARRRSRAPSLGSSLSSSFIMRAPTSPLVNATNNPSLDFSESHPPPQHMNRANRRRTLPSPISSSLQLSPLDMSPIQTPPNLRHENTVPARSHQARRSLTSFTYQPAPSASTVYPSRQRRLSHASESSPRNRTSMVGSFEESIIRGRMSTAPSKPLDFVAKIGVVGKGAGLEKMRCPAQVSVPFPAVFYNYSSTPGPRSIQDDSPSPYVGTIDLQHNLQAPDDRPRKKRRPESNDPDAVMAELTGPESTTIGKALTAQKEALPGKSDIGGAYRVPQQGQLQVMIKNPNNTAVKLFLVPYDLSGMQPATKTFVRQRSFSSGPIMENVLSDKPIEDPMSDKQVLRYLIHLKFCCLSKGRFYLYDGIRIVFANRVPDGKEKLRNEVQVPEPKFSSLVLGGSQSSSRRHSQVDRTLTTRPAPSLGLEGLDMMDGLTQPSLGVPTPFSHSHLPDMPSRETEPRPNSRQVSNGSSSKSSSRPTSPEVHGFSRSSISISQRGSPVPWGTAIDLPRSPSPAVSHDGLLSKKLRELGRQTARTSLEDAGEAREGSLKDA